MEQLRAISFCSSPRSYRNRNTSLILRMDKPFWGIRFLLCSRGEIPNRLSSAAFCSNSESPIPRCQYRTRSYRVCSLVARIIHIPGISIHMPGILILILPESLFSSSRNPYSHAPEYALEAIRVIHDLEDLFQNLRGARDRVQRGILPSEEIKKKAGDPNPQPHSTARFEAHADTNPIRPAEQRYVQQHGSAAYAQFLLRLLDELFPPQ